MIPKVSIIVPIYNVEKYLDKCINSLLNQSLKEIEIILVDDGSPDNSGKIAEKYAIKDNRISVVHQQNMGLGPARNTGVDLATGEYIAFVDSDDWVDVDMYSHLYKEAIKTNADIVVGGHCEMMNDITKSKKVHPLSGFVYKNKEEILKVRKNFFGQYYNDEIGSSFPKSAWRSIYRHQIIKDNNLRFEKILSEDTIFNLLVYKYSQVISFTNFTDYKYRKDNQTSITQAFSTKKLDQYEQFLQKLFELAKLENDCECEIRAKRTAIEYCRLYVKIVDNTNESLKNKIKYLKEFAENDVIKDCWKGYPLKKLPIQQMLFQFMIQKGHYGVVLCMNQLHKVFIKTK